MAGTLTYERKCDTRTYGEIALLRGWGELVKVPCFALYTRAKSNWESRKGDLERLENEAE